MAPGDDHRMGNQNTVRLAVEADAERWRAVLARSAEADGRFFYAVRTTGVYCRPTCPSRRPRRENVEFFATTAQAEAGGFRACRRCSPSNGHGPVSAAERVRRACRLIDDAEDTPDLKAIAEAAGLSPFHFHRLFRRLVGVTPREYVAARHTGRLRESLQRGTSVTEAIYDAGFSSSSRVYETAGEALGMTPGAYRAGAPGLTITYAITRCSLGVLLVATTPRGVCTIELGDRPDALRRRLGQRFAKATVVQDDGAVKPCVEAVTRYLDAPAQNIDLPLDVRGTAFQRRVWTALRRLRAGTTTTYTDLARRIGQPRAARAVARACASNTIALAIPCHRVIRGDGSLSGYRWGVERKRTLLDRERAASERVKRATRPAAAARA
jgi:AraC family transcriptional regulator, regulatory protein of adaptative response / methylated-DNA-[protein]-cysteine methyltransferase